MLKKMWPKTLENCPSFTRWNQEDYLPRIQQNFQPSQSRFLTFYSSHFWHSNSKAGEASFFHHQWFNYHLCKNTSPHISVYFLYSLPDFLLVIHTPPLSRLRAIILVITELLWQPGSSGVLVRSHTTCVLKKKQTNQPNQTKRTEAKFLKWPLKILKLHLICCN